MAPETKSSHANPSNSKKRKNRYLPQNKPVKKGSYPLRPGVQGFFITCDGGRERQAAHEAIDVIDSFYEELVQGDDSGGCLAVQPSKPVNKKTIFTYSDSSSSDDDDDDDDEEEEEEEESKESENKKEEGEKQSDSHRDDNANCGGPENENFDPSEKKNVSCEIQREGKKDDKADGKEDNGKADEIERSIDGAMEPFPKKQCLESATAKSANISRGKAEEQSIDKLIEAEIQQLGNKNKRRFISLDSGCNGVCFVQMRRRDGDPSVKDIVQHMMTSAALKRKHISRFILRVLPIEVACYASEADIAVSIKPLIEGYFPVETQNPLKFAVLYDARANTGIERMKIINAVAKSVPAPHKVDLNNPDKNIVVQIVKTVCLIGVIEKYKVLGKYNLRQLTSPQE